VLNSAPDPDVDFVIDGRLTKSQTYDYSNIDVAQTKHLVVGIWSGGERVYETVVEPTGCRTAEGEPNRDMIHEAVTLCINYYCPGYRSDNPVRTCRTQVQAPLSAPTCQLPPYDNCNPVQNTACGPGEKCAHFNGIPGRVTCVPAPEVPIPVGGICTDAIQTKNGWDECESGAACIGGECRRLCYDASNCPSGACTLEPTNFECKPEIGLCEP